MAGGIQVPVASVQQPTANRAPAQNTYTPRERIGGAIQGRFESGPAFLTNTSGGENSAAFGRGLEALGAVWEKEIHRRQNIEAMEEINAFRDRERLAFEQMNEMKGKAGYDEAFQLMSDFYDREGPALLEKSRGRHQELYYAEELSRSRDAGLNRAMAYRIEQGSVYGASVLRRRMAAAYEKIQNDPANAPLHEAELDDIIDAANPGADNTAGKLAARAQSREAQRAAYTSRYEALLLSDPQAAAHMAADDLSRFGAEQLFNPDELAAMRKNANLAIDGEYVKNQAGRYERLLFMGTEQDRVKVMAEISNDIRRVRDPERRTLMLRGLDQSLSNIAMVNGANDMAARKKFLALAAENNWNPSQMLARVDTIQGMTRDAKAALSDRIQKGLVNTETVENRTALARGRALADRGADENGVKVDDTYLFAYGQKYGLTTGQMAELVQYKDGGRKGALTQSLVDRVSTFLSPNTPAPPQLFEEVLGMLPDGEKPTFETVSKIVAHLTMSGARSAGVNNG